MSGVVDWPEVKAPGTLSADDLQRQRDASAVADEGPHRGQTRIALRLARTHDGKLLHVHGLGWHYWDGARWAEDDRGMATRAVLDVIRAALAETVGERTDASKELVQDARRCETASGIDGVLRIASALPQFAATVRDLDADPYLLNCANGTLDLRTMKLRPAQPRDRITKVTGARYNPEAKSPTWERFLETSLPDGLVRAFLARYAGLGVCGQVIEHTLAILTGAGRNGKGVWYGAVAHALGDYAATAEPDLFMHRDGAHPTGEMDLRGVRWVVVSESDKGRKLAEATVKRLTGGDKIKARRMRQDFVEFTPSHTAALITNFLPEVSGDDPALWARLRVIPFDVVIRPEDRDPRLGSKLQADADAVLAWLVEGWAEYSEIGMCEPEAVLAATGEYKRAQDAVGRWLEEECFASPAVTTKFAVLFDAWEKWGARERADPLTKREFSDALGRAGYPSARGSGNVAVHRGIALAAREDEPRR